MALPGEMGAWAVLCSGGHSAPGLVSTSQSLTPYHKGLWLERLPSRKAGLPLRGLHFLSQLKTTTTAALSRDFTEDRIWLNGREEDIGQPRLQACLQESEWDPLGQDRVSPWKVPQTPLPTLLSPGGRGSTC